MKVAQLCLTLCDSMDYSLPGSSVHRILQAMQEKKALSSREFNMVQILRNYQIAARQMDEGKKDLIH